MASPKTSSAAPASALYLVCGDDDFLVKEAARSVVARIVPEEMRDMGLEVIDCDVGTGEEACNAMARCFGSLETPGFFGGVKLTWMKDVSFMPAGKNKRCDTADVQERIALLVEWIKGDRLSADLPLLISTTSVNRNSSLFRACKAKGQVIDLGSDQKPKERDALAEARLDARAKALGLKMPPAVRRAFILKVGQDAGRIEMEADKLACYVGEGGTATEEDVDAIASAGRESFGWDVQDAFGLRDAARFISTTRANLAQGGKVMMLASLLDSRIRELVFAREALDRGWIAASPGGVRFGALPPEIEEWFEADPRSDVRKANPWRYGRIVEQAGRWRLNELRLARYRFVEMREKMVSTGLDAEILFEATGLKCIGRRRA